GRRLVQHREEPMSRPWRTALVIGAAGAVAAAVAGAAVGLGGGAAGAGPGTRPVPGSPPVAPAPMTPAPPLKRPPRHRGPVYADPVGVTGASGVLPGLAAPGAVGAGGQPVYKADNQPVPLFYGRLPLYRPLQAGDVGADVTEVERNLAALGYTGVTVDRYYTAATAAAVWQWQHDNGLTPTGVLTPAEVVLAPGRVRRASLPAHLGDQAAGPALTYTGDRKSTRLNSS